MAVPVALSMLIDELDRLGRERDDAWQIPRVEGELLRQIALSHHAKLIVEIGTSYGFSGLFWASALRTTGGKLHTVLPLCTSAKPASKRDSANRSSIRKTC